MTDPGAESILHAGNPILSGKTAPLAATLNRRHLTRARGRAGGGAGPRQAPRAAQDRLQAAHRVRKPHARVPRCAMRPGGFLPNSVEGSRPRHRHHHKMGSGTESTFNSYAHVMTPSSHAHAHHGAQPQRERVAARQWDVQVPQEEPARKRASRRSGVRARAMCCVKCRMCLIICVLRSIHPCTVAQPAQTVFGTFALTKLKLC